MTRAAALLALLLTGCANQATLARFNQTLASHDSATLALEQWCAARGIATPARIEAVPQDDAQASPASPAIRAALGVGRDNPVRVRHVQLLCGTAVLSDAYNWYVPARLTADMNRALDTTHTPFGKSSPRSACIASRCPPAPGRPPAPPGRSATIPRCCAATTAWPIAWSANATRAPTSIRAQRRFRRCFLIGINDTPRRS